LNDLKRTPLYDRHVSMGAKMVPFGGWEMPVQYTGIIEEHRQVREDAGIFDVSHMGEIVVEGQSALASVQKIITNNAKRLDPGWIDLIKKQIIGTGNCQSFVKTTIII